MSGDDCVNLMGSNSVVHRSAAYKWEMELSETLCALKNSFKQTAKFTYNIAGICLMTCLVPR